MKEKEKEESKRILAGFKGKNQEIAAYEK